MKVKGSNRYIMKNLPRTFSYLTLGFTLMLSTGCGTLVKSFALRHPKAKSLFDQPQFDRVVTHQGHIDSIGEGENQITVLYVSGTSYEMGFEHGRLLRDDVHATINKVMEGADKFLPKSIRESKFLTRGDKKVIVNAILDKAYNTMAPYIPRQDLEEMRGLSDGSGIPLEVIHRVHAIPDLGETSCSALVVRGDATRDGHTYQLRILDYGANFSLHERPLITVYQPAKGHTFINIGWIGFVGVVSGMNEEGVALSEMGFGKPPGETLAGMPMPFLLKNVLRYADNAEAGAAIVRAAERTNSYVYFIGDRGGDAIGMITSAQEAMTYRVNEFETVAFREKTYPQFKDILYAGHFQDKQAELVSKLAGTFDLKTIQDLARDIAMHSNLHTVIYDLSSGIMWISNREGDTRASDRPYVEFDFASELAKIQKKPSTHQHVTSASDRDQVGHN